MNEEKLSFSVQISLQFSKSHSLAYRLASCFHHMLLVSCHTTKTSTTNSTPIPAAGSFHIIACVYSSTESTPLSTLSLSLPIPISKIQNHLLLLINFHVLAIAIDYPQDSWPHFFLILCRIPRITPIIVDHSHSEC